MLPGRLRGRAVAALAVLSLALGIAGNAVVFSVVSALVFPPLPYPEPERLVLVGQREKGQPESVLLSALTSLPIFADYRERSRTLTDWAALTFDFRSLSDEDRSVSVLAGEVTPSFLRVLGATPVLGRIFTEGEGVEGGARVAILSWEYWQSSLGGRSDPVGSVLLLDGEPHEVIGVLAEGFEFILQPQPVDVWVPLDRYPYAYSRGDRFAVAVARMAPGATMEGVDAEVARIAGELEGEFPESFRGWTMGATNFRTDLPDPQGRLYMAIMQGAVFFVLLIACANITNLLLARGQDRRREIAVRAALGAGRFRVVAQLTRESLGMAAMGGVAGLALAVGGIRMSAAHMASIPVLPRLWQPSLDLKVVSYTVGLTLFSGILFGVLPALQTFTVNQVEALKQGGGSGTGRRRRRIVEALVVGQVALSLAALGAGFVLERAFVGLRGGNPGFDTERLLFAQLEGRFGPGPTVEWNPLAERIRERVAGLPGVVSAALVTPLPKNIAVRTGPFRTPGVLEEEGVALPSAVPVWASPEYLETLDFQLLQGRFIEESDRQGTPLVAVVNRAMAERHFPDGGALGQLVRFWGETREIVGVVTDVQQGLVPRPGGGYREVMYIPVEQDPLDRYSLLLRTRGDPRALADTVRAEIWAEDPRVTISVVQTMDDFAGQWLAGLDIFNVILGAFGVLALLLASLGTYGVVAYSVSQRTHEIGVRLTLGARPRSVVSMMALRGVRMSVTGIVLGSLILFPVVRTLDRVLADLALDPVNPVALLVVGALLFSVTVVASVAPATRAARVEPAAVLKVD